MRLNEIYGRHPEEDDDDPEPEETTETVVVKQFYLGHEDGAEVEISIKAEATGELTYTSAPRRGKYYDEDDEPDKEYSCNLIVIQAAIHEGTYYKWEDLRTHLAGAKHVSAEGWGIDEDMLHELVVDAVKKENGYRQVSYMNAVKIMTWAEATKEYGAMAHPPNKNGR